MSLPNSLNAKFKQKENLMRDTLPAKSIVGIRLDGKAFSKFTKQYEEPFDLRFMNTMDQTAIFVMEKIISGYMFAYVQSDEMTIFFSDLWNENSQFAYNGKIEKILSTSASAATGGFMSYDSTINDVPIFDARVFVLDNMDEVEEYLDWRRLDARKNAITMAASCVASHKELMNVSTFERAKLLENTAYETLPDGFFNGRLIVRETVFEKVTYFDGRNNEKTVRVERNRLKVKNALRETATEIIEEMKEIFA